MRPGALLVAVALASGAAPAAAESKGGKTTDVPLPPPPPGTVLRPRPAAAKAPSSRSDPGLDFDLLGAPPDAMKPRSDPELESRVQWRRRMLLVHQALGLTTLGALAATTTVGQLNLNDKYRGGGDTGRYRALHKELAYSSAALFAVTGAVAVLAPVPYAKRGRFDSATAHKIAMATATAGMLAQIALGAVTRSREGHLDQRAYATAHQAVGYATLGAMTVGVISFVF